MSTIIFFSQFWGHGHLFSACRGAIPASLKQEPLQMWMFGILTSALAESANQPMRLEKTAKLIQLCLHLWSPVSCGLHLMNFNLNVTIFFEWQADLTECTTEEPPQREFEPGQLQTLPMGSLSLFCEVPENVQFCRRRVYSHQGGVYERFTWVLSI